MTGLAHTVQAWTVHGNAKELEQMRQPCREQLLPRPALLCVNRSEAAALLGVAPLTTRNAVEQAAKTLRTWACQAVVVTGSDDADYADTPQASGWLGLPELAAQPVADTGVDAVFAANAATALARGFVAMEAIILAKMATADALRHRDATGVLQPRADFALHISNLPHFSLPQPTPVQGFSALSDANLGLYAVVDSAKWVERVVAAGVSTVQLRIKNAEQTGRREFIRQQVRQAIAAARAAGAQLFVNDHWQLAIEEGAYGVHLGQEDLHIADLAAIRQAGLRLGISTHAYWEVCRAWALQPSYIACGPIHPTQAKAMPWIAQGNDNLAYWRLLLPLPVVGIGGMDALRTEQAAQCGVAGVAVISAITAAASPEAAIAQLQEALKRGRSRPKAAAAPFLPKSTLSSLA
jgi:hydroxymethylpyrimidine kinase/phosphomethylpyrimidine kinase/thiamine-phosphate diphosphorylase